MTRTRHPVQHPAYWITQGAGGWLLRHKMLTGDPYTVGVYPTQEKALSALQKMENPQQQAKQQEDQEDIA